MASKKLLELMNKSVAREMQVSIQYMWQHVQWSGIYHYAIKDELKKNAIAEMKHAEEIAERLFYLGGVPTTKPEPIFVGKTLKEMLVRDIKDEEGAIRLYKQIIALAQKENDPTTARLFRKILHDEEEHHDFFQGVLEGLK
ncbi:MAG TPA: ferritin-like domain-containing protein [Syntrophales bacterium]|jgi:bacterioferritin|nr:ferritin-like domain-containing protein [Syntrophales bacterium]HOX93782.1 ferritin-like domain-containing protein [Syntrophales bacterium]HPI57731.1 ferritin-like domain-containing protein [Syntrophales bacterium]HPN23964.1 ferritin-like domain-containing protein [Syntrophales bacterium]HQM28243.1 ferritin-like domain-containing protein [Syntrophales bacterium]